MVRIASEPISGDVNHYCRKWALDTEESHPIAFYIVIDFKTWYKNAPEGSEDPANLYTPLSCPSNLMERNFLPPCAVSVFICGTAVITSPICCYFEYNLTLGECMFNQTLQGLVDLESQIKQPQNCYPRDLFCLEIFVSALPIDAKPKGT